MRRLMVLFNYSTKELTAKVVYYGPGLCGKTTNLQWIHEKLPIKNKGKMLSLATETDRTLFFDFLPIELGTIRGMKTRIQLYTVPGQVFYNATRRMVLKGADCVVYVCDSQEAVLEANLESFENLKQNLEANEIDPNEIPMVLQYNKRDLPNALPLEILNERMNPKGIPFFEAVAVKGIGVEETLKGVTGLVFRSLASKYGGAEATGGTPAFPLQGAVPVAATPAPVRPPAAAAAPPHVPAPAAVRPSPPVPAPRPAPPRAASATLPPLNMTPAPQPSEDLLESLELQPSGDAEALPLEADEEEFDLSEPAEHELEELSAEEELSFDTPPPSPPNPRETLVRSESEAEDLRRRIGRPALPDVSLEHVEEEESEVDEIPLDLDPEPAPAPPPAPVAVRAAAATPAPITLPPRAAVPAAPAPVVRPAPAPVPAVVPAPPHPAPVAAPAPAPTVTTAPVAVRLDAQGQTDVLVPVQVTVSDGTAQVLVQLRLTLNLRLER